MSDWIPVSERLPEEGKEVLFCDAYGNFMLAEYLEVDEDDYGKSYTAENDGCVMYDVVAWLPLPEPYKGE